MSRQQHEDEQTSDPIITSPVPITASAVAAQRPDETQTQPLIKEEREAFMTRLQQQTLQQKRRYRALYATYMIGIVLYLIGITAKFAGYIPRESPAYFLVNLIPLIYSLFIFGAQAAGRKWKRSVFKLAETGDPRYLGPLIEAYMAEGGKSREQQNAIRVELIDRLPQLRVSDAHLIDSTQRKILNRLLGRRS